MIHQKRLNDKTKIQKKNIKKEKFSVFSYSRLDALLNNWCFRNRIESANLIEPSINDLFDPDLIQFDHNSTIGLVLKP